MASDMHFGVLSGKAHAVRLVKEINDLKPDLVLFLAISSMTIWMPILAKGSIRSDRYPGKVWCVCLAWQS